MVGHEIESWQLSLRNHSMRDPVQFTLEHLDDYLHGLLSEEDARFVEEQCEKSNICRAAVEEAQKRYDALRSIPPSEASEQLIRKTVEGVEMKVTRSRRTWKIFSRTVLAVTAAAVLIIGGLNLYYYNLAPTPYDVRLLGQNELLSGSFASIHVQVIDRRTGRPANYDRKIATTYDVTLLDLDGGRRETLATNVSFVDRFKVPDWPSGDYELQVTAFTNEGQEVLSRTVQLKRQWKLLLSTDKPVYKPGQVIHLRSLALRQPDLKPAAGNEVSFSVTDAKGNIVFRQHDVTSKFGLSSADFELADEVNEGTYRIECQVGETTSSRSVEVQRYVLPKFRVSIDLEEPFYAPGGNVKGSVQADYFFGQPVAGASVTIEARPIGFDSDTIESLELKTDDAGRAEFSFTLPNRLVGREQDGGDARVQVAATVTDTAGQTYSAGASRVVAAEPIRLEVIPESGTLVKDVENLVYVYASYADGRPAQVKLIVSGREEEIATSSLGVAELKLTPTGDVVGLTLRATDDQGLVGRRHVELARGKAARDFVVRPDQAVYDGGATMTLSALGGGVEPVFVDLIKDGQTMLSKTINLASGKGEAQIDLPPELFGTLRLVAFRFDDSGVAVRKERLIFVRQANELSIEATLDAQEYRPGETAKLNVKLTDASGRPVVGAVSLAAVDEAVFSVLNQSTGMEKVFFLLEQELLEPVYAIYNGWSPEMLGNVPLAEREEFNRALFSLTAESDSGPKALPVDFVTPQAVDVDEPRLDAVGPDRFPGWREVVPADSKIESTATASPYTLAAQSFPAKEQEIRTQREAGLAGVVIAWLSLGGALFLVGSVAFAVYRPKAFLITAGVMSCVLLASFCLLTLAVLSTHATFRVATAGGLDGFADAATGAMEFALGEEAPKAVILLDDSNSMAWGELVSAEKKPRVRQFFPETLLWRPELVTDEQGVATLDIPLADSITTWRLSASAVSGDGRLGTADFPIKVFQPFFVDLDLPVALTRGDEVAVPVVVYNYLDRPQTVKLALKDDAWFTRMEDAADDNQQQTTLTLELAPREVRSLSFPIKVEKVGLHALEVTASARDEQSRDEQSGVVADAIRREIEVVPNGRRVETVASGSLGDPAEVALHIPEDAIEGSVRATVKLYPSSFSQLVEGLDAIFQMPYGCFEQTSSTTYPNVLALDYLRRTKKSAPAVEAKARQYINTGYQRLVSFEVSDGGFDWFGNPPANRTLTAYGLLEFEDMAAVYDVDPQLIERTRSWLLSQRREDGAWPNERGMLDDGLGGSVNRGRNADLASTAYIAWAVFGTGKAEDEAQRTLDFLISHRPGTIDNPYKLAIMIRAIAGIEPQHESLEGYLDRLAELAQHSEDGKLAWWKQPEGQQTTFYGSGRSGDIEATAMAALAMLKTNDDPGTVKAALNWLVQQKDPRGTWHSTQATVLALKALIEATGKPLGGDVRRHIEIALDGQVVRKVDISADQGDVVQQLDLTDLVTAGDHQLSLRETTGTGTGYQVNVRHHVEGPVDETQQEPLSIELAYDRRRLDVDDTVMAVATVTNNLPQTAPMVILDLPIPGGFTLEPGELDELKGSGKLAKYQLTPRKAIVYLRGLASGESLELRYRLRATMPVKVAVPAAVAYEYYNPDHRGESEAVELEAAAK
jgi:hypothetical protein